MMRHSGPHIPRNIAKRLMSFFGVFPPWDDTEWREHDHRSGDIMVPKRIPAEEIREMWIARNCAMTHGDDGKVGGHQAIQNVFEAPIKWNCHLCWLPDPRKTTHDCSENSGDWWCHKAHQPFSWTTRRQPRWSSRAQTWPRDIISQGRHERKLASGRWNKITNRGAAGVILNPF